MPLEYYSCKPCDKIFNGKRPYEDHIVSSNHQKKMNQGGVAHEVVDSSKRITQGLPQLPSDPFIVLKETGYYCNVCSLTLNGPDPMKAHIVGSKHLKMKSKQPLNGCENVGKVDLCTMKMSHCPKDCSDSYAHAENMLLGVKKFDVNLPEQYSDPFIIQRGTGYYCNICNLPLNGPEPLKAHIVGSKHLKMRSKQPLNRCGDIVNVDLSTMKMCDSPMDSSDLYADIESALPDVKVFKVDDPIEF